MRQLTIVEPDRPGLATDITELLATAGVNIESFDAETTGDTAVVVLTVDRYDAALQALHRSGFHPVTEDALLVRLEDKPGALAAVAKRFRDANISLRSLRIIRATGGQTLAVIATDRTDEAVALVKDILVS
ncbi:MAG: ACT domain-containing protein [Gemmataceae bacterium]